MTDPSARKILGDQYLAALRAYISGAGEAALAQAYELGRRASNEGVGILEMAIVHHDALDDVLSHASGDGCRPIPLAAQFFAESISPLEMKLRAFRANARVLGLDHTVAKQHHEIDRARQRLQTILDATTAVIYLKDSEGRYLFVNHQFQKVFGVDSGQVIGRTDAEILPRQVADALGPSDRQALDDGVARDMEQTIPIEGAPHTYLCLKFPLVDEGQSAHAVCCVATDITERKRADEAVRQAKEAAEAANKELESFSYSVAHDLRAPLRSIDGFSQALLEDCAERLDSQGKRYLEQVRESAQHMARLIDDLLSLSRVSQADLRHVRVDLSSTARRIVAGLQAREPGRDVRCFIQDGMFADGDPILLRAVLENLLGNAWKFTRRRPVAHIDFGMQGRTLPCVYFVRDDGAGFDMAYSGKLFGVFQRLHSMEEFEGTGIGLATVHRIVHRHRGRVWAEGEADRGATFYFTLEEEASGQPARSISVGQQSAAD